MKQKILVVGYGYVGSAYGNMLAKRYDVRALDPEKGYKESHVSRSECALALICVPTPRGADGSCDTSLAEHVIENDIPDHVPVLIKSTVTPGTTARIALGRPSATMFSPEYISEGGYYVPSGFPHPTAPEKRGFMVIGAQRREDAEIVIDLFAPVVGPHTRFRVMSPTEAELVKYYTNAFLALKVTFAAEMREVCEASDVAYHTVREGWLDDPRIGPSHSLAFGSATGFGGKCLPKDAAALEHYAHSVGVPATLLSAMILSNNRRAGR